VTDASGVVRLVCAQVAPGVGDLTGNQDKVLGGRPRRSGRSCRHRRLYGRPVLRPVAGLLADTESIVVVGPASRAKGRHSGTLLRDRRPELYVRGEK